MRKILTALFVLAFVSTASALEVNQDAPLFSLRDKDGEFFHLSDNVTPHGWVGRKYMVKGLPMTFFISSDGKIKDILPGERHDFEKALREKAGKLLK